MIGFLRLWRSPLRVFIKVALKGVLLFLFLSISLVCLLKWVAPPTTSFMVQRKWQAVTAREPETTIRYEWVAYANISPHMRLAVVAAEDQRFPHHCGFDLEEIGKVWRSRQNGGRVRGASTISQQVVKNLFLWPERSLFRKGLEAYFTLLIEFIWDKRRILEVYLNIAQTGDRMFGVEAASRTYFNKPVGELTRQEAALIAAVLPNPYHYSVQKPSDYVKRRKQWILRQMNSLGGVGYLKDL